MKTPNRDKLAGVSFIIPAFNCAKTIAESVASVLNGNFESDDEIVIVDDGSDEETKAELQRLASTHGGIRLLAHRYNRGGGETRNTAVDAARHSLIFCLDSDNVLAPASVPALRRYLEETGADVVSFQELRYFKNHTGEISLIWQFKPGLVTMADYFANNVVPGASGNYLYTVASWRKARGYPNGHHLDTWGFGFRQLASGAKMHVLPGTYYFHRYGHESYWIRGVRENRTSLYALQIILPHLELFEPGEIKYLLSAKGRATWFDRNAERPIRLLGQKAGHGGVQKNLSGHPEMRPSLLHRAARALRRIARRRFP
jgi:glycosyltransferase involved in cell wall biosynthesis